MFINGTFGGKEDFGMPKTLFDFNPEPPQAQAPPVPTASAPKLKLKCPKCGSDRVAVSEEKHKRKHVKDGKVQTDEVVVAYKYCLSCHNRWSSDEEDG
jgi:hypothetical protein